MGKEEKSGQEIHATVTGDVSGQVAIGAQIQQTQAIGAVPPEVTEEDREELRRLFADLRALVEAQAPPEKQAAAVGRVQELQEAVTAPKPDLTTMEYVKQWFAKHVPALAGAVTSIVVHPIVGKLVTVAGDALVAEFRRRFGPSPAKQG